MPPKPFKPPRPISSTSTSTSSFTANPASTSTTTNRVSKPSTTSSRTIASRPKSKATAATKSAPSRPDFPALSDDDDDDFGGHPDIDNTSTNDDLTNNNGTGVQRQDQEPAIPPKLIARLLHEHFQDKDTRITKEAMSVLCGYVDVFAREAVARCCFGKDEGEGEGDFLEVEDLEKIAPQLLLDF